MTSPLPVDEGARAMDPFTALRQACSQAGVPAAGAELIRDGENTLIRLPGQVVARVTRPGQVAAARKEVQVSGWLQAMGLPVVVALDDVEQPIRVVDRAVTFWRELPPHRRSTRPELAAMLRRLHALPAPEFELPALDPFVRLRERIGAATVFDAIDRAWLLEQLDDVQQRYRALPPGRSWCAIHGDAWAGNLVVTDAGPVLLDLERFAYGPPEWDLTSIAVNHTTSGAFPRVEWEEFCARYGGYDVITWPGFETLRDARELRQVTFAAQIAGRQPEAVEQARYRLACIQGRAGERPWGWVGVP